jgi:uncharacterized protein (DUF736 family)
MPSAAVFRSASGLTAADRSFPGPRTAIEAAMVAARQQRKTTMATIGTFTAADNGYTGSVKTLTLNVKARFVATEKENDKAPDYRIEAGSIEFGAAWEKTARESDREYLSVRLDDPSFPAPIYASLVKGEGGRQLHPDLVPPYSRMIRRDRRPRLSGGGGFPRSWPRRRGNRGEEDLRSACSRDNRSADLAAPSPHYLRDCSMRGDGPVQAESREDGHAARADNRRIRLPMELIAIWSAWTLPACRQEHFGSTQLASDRLATLEAANGMTSRSKTCYADIVKCLARR